MHKRLVAIALVTATLAGACSQPASIVQVTLSGDETRLEIIFDSCNAPLDGNVTESADAVRISVDRINREWFSGDDCQDVRIHQLTAARGDRPVIDGATGVPIRVLDSPSAHESTWPYDTSRFSREQYEAALDDMVDCLMECDPQVTAWVYQSLDCKWYSSSKETDANGMVSTTALEPCEQENLAPSSRASTTRWITVASCVKTQQAKT